MISRVSASTRESGASADAVEHVRDAIRSGRFAPGDRIIEREIADELGISSIAVRDAFARLAQEGWIERLPRRGVRVRPLDAETIDDITSVRALLEGEAASRAAARIARGDVDGELDGSALGLVEGFIPALGDLVTLLAILKSLPLSYNRDLQEDKRPLLGGPPALVETLDALAGAVATARFDARAARASAIMSRISGATIDSPHNPPATTPKIASALPALSHQSGSVSGPPPLPAGGL